MEHLNEDSGWVDGICQLKVTDRAEGGPDGIMSRQASELASRTAVLRNSIEGLSSSFSAALSAESFARTQGDSALRSSIDSIRVGEGWTSGRNLFDVLGVGTIPARPLKNSKFLSHLGPEEHIYPLDDAATLKPRPRLCRLELQ